MRECWSVIEDPFQLSPLRSVLIIILIFIAFIMIGCSPESPNDYPINPQNTTIQKNQRDAAQIEDSIINSYARLAAKRKDICPKLLRKNRGNSTIERVAEVMVDEHCDYFLYLNAGQQISVTLDNNQIEALLVVPKVHNFADGYYKVASYDKHVIRLTYNGIEYKPQRLNYDVTIKITD